MKTASIIGWVTTARERWDRTETMRDMRQIMNPGERNGAMARPIDIAIALGNVREGWERLRQEKRQ